MRGEHKIAHIGRLIREHSHGFRLISDPVAIELLEIMIAEEPTNHRPKNDDRVGRSAEEQKWYDLITAIPSMYQFKLTDRIPDYFDMANEAMKVMHEQGLDVTHHIRMLTRYSEATGIPYKPPKLNGNKRVPA